MNKPAALATFGVVVGAIILIAMGVALGPLPFLAICIFTIALFFAGLIVQEIYKHFRDNVFGE